MSRTINFELLPPEVRRRREAGEITNGEYQQIIPGLPDLSLCDHAEVYAGHCEAQRLTADPRDAAAFLHHFVLPELIARLRGVPLPEARPLDPGSGFFRLLSAEQIARALGRHACSAAARLELTRLHPLALAVRAEESRQGVPCRWSADDLVYDATLHHLILPELIRRVRRTGLRVL